MSYRSKCGCDCGSIRHNNNGGSNDNVIANNIYVDGKDAFLIAMALLPDEKDVRTLALKAYEIQYHCDNLAEINEQEAKIMENQ